MEAVQRHDMPFNVDAVFPYNVGEERVAFTLCTAEIDDDDSWIDPNDRCARLYPPPYPIYTMYREGSASMKNPWMRSVSTTMISPINARQWPGVPEMHEVLRETSKMIRDIQKSVEMHGEKAFEHMASGTEERVFFLGMTRRTIFELLDRINTGTGGYLFLFRIGTFVSDNEIDMLGKVALPWIGNLVLEGAYGADSGASQVKSISSKKQNEKRNECKLVRGHWKLMNRLIHDSQVRDGSELGDYTAMEAFLPRLHPYSPDEIKAGPMIIKKIQEELGIGEMHRYFDSVAFHLPPRRVAFLNRQFMVRMLTFLGGLGRHAIVAEIQKRKVPSHVAEDVGNHALAVFMSLVKRGSYHVYMPMHEQATEALYVYLLELMGGSAYKASGVYVDVDTSYFRYVPLNYFSVAEAHSFVLATIVGPTRVTEDAVSCAHERLVRAIKDIQKFFVPVDDVRGQIGYTAAYYARARDFVSQFDVLKRIYAYMEKEKIAYWEDRGRVAKSILEFHRYLHYTMIIIGDKRDASVPIHLYDSTLDAFIKGYTGLEIAISYMAEMPLLGDEGPGTFYDLATTYSERARILVGLMGIETAWLPGGQAWRPGDPNPMPLVYGIYGLGTNGVHLLHFPLQFASIVYSTCPESGDLKEWWSQFRSAYPRIRTSMQNFHAGLKNLLQEERIDPMLREVVRIVADSPQESGSMHIKQEKSTRTVANTYPVIRARELGLIVQLFMNTVAHRYATLKDPRHTEMGPNFLLVPKLDNHIAPAVLEDFLEGAVWTRHDPFHSALAYWPRGEEAFIRMYSRKTMEVVKKKMEGRVNKYVENVQERPMHVIITPRMVKEQHIVTLEAFIDTNSEKQLLWLLVGWMWKPAREKTQYSFITKKRNPVPLRWATPPRRVTSRKQQLRIRACDGIEGTYYMVVGNSSAGWMYSKPVYVSVQLKCVRSGHVYEEAKNHYAAITWDEARPTYISRLPSQTDLLDAIIEYASHLVVRTLSPATMSGDTEPISARAGLGAEFRDVEAEYKEEDDTWSAYLMDLGLVPVDGRIAFAKEYKDSNGISRVNFTLTAHKMVDELKTAVVARVRGEVGVMLSSETRYARYGHIERVYSRYLQISGSRLGAREKKSILAMAKQELLSLLRIVEKEKNNFKTITNVGRHSAYTRNPYFTWIPPHLELGILSDKMASYDMADVRAVVLNEMQYLFGDSLTGTQHLFHSIFAELMPVWQKSIVPEFREFIRGVFLVHASMAFNARVPRLLLPALGAYIMLSTKNDPSYMLKLEDEGVFSNVEKYIKVPDDQFRREQMDEFDAEDDIEKLDSAMRQRSIMLRNRVFSTFEGHGERMARVYLKSSQTDMVSEKAEYDDDHDYMNGVFISRDDVLEERGMGCIPVLSENTDTGLKNNKKSGMDKDTRAFDTHVRKLRMDVEVIKADSSKSRQELAKIASILQKTYSDLVKRTPAAPDGGRARIDAKIQKSIPSDIAPGEEMDLGQIGNYGVRFCGVPKSELLDMKYDPMPYATFDEMQELFTFFIVNEHHYRSVVNYFLVSDMLESEVDARVLLDLVQVLSRRKISSDEMSNWRAVLGNVANFQNDMSAFFGAVAAVRGFSGLTGKAKTLASRMVRRPAQDPDAIVLIAKLKKMSGEEAIGMAGPSPTNFEFPVFALNALDVAYYNRVFLPVLVGRNVVVCHPALNAYGFPNPVMIAPDAPDKMRFVHKAIVDYVYPFMFLTILCRQNPKDYNKIYVFDQRFLTGAILDAAKASKEVILNVIDDLMAGTTEMHEKRTYVSLKEAVRMYTDFDALKQCYDEALKNLTAADRARLDREEQKRKDAYDKANAKAERERQARLEKERREKEKRDKEERARAEAERKERKILEGARQREREKREREERDRAEAEKKEKERIEIEQQKAIERQIREENTRREAEREEKEKMAKEKQKERDNEFKKRNAIFKDKVRKIRMKMTTLDKKLKRALADFDRLLQTNPRSMEATERTHARMGEIIMALNEYFADAVVLRQEISNLVYFIFTDEQRDQYTKLVTDLNDILQRILLAKTTLPAQRTEFYVRWMGHFVGFGGPIAPPSVPRLPSPDESPMVPPPPLKKEPKKETKDEPKEEQDEKPSMMNARETKDKIDNWYKEFIMLRSVVYGSLDQMGNPSVLSAQDLAAINLESIKEKLHLLNVQAMMLRAEIRKYAAIENLNMPLKNADTIMKDVDSVLKEYKAKMEIVARIAAAKRIRDIRDDYTRLKKESESSDTTVIAPSTGVLYGDEKVGGDAESDDFDALKQAEAYFKDIRVSGYIPASRMEICRKAIDFEHGLNVLSSMEDKFGMDMTHGYHETIAMHNEKLEFVIRHGHVVPIAHLIVHFTKMIIDRVDVWATNPEVIHGKSAASIAVGLFHLDRLVESVMTNDIQSAMLYMENLSVPLSDDYAHFVYGIVCILRVLAGILTRSRSTIRKYKALVLGGGDMGSRSAQKRDDMSTTIDLLFHPRYGVVFMTNFNHGQKALLECIASIESNADFLTRYKSTYSGKYDIGDSISSTQKLAQQFSDLLPLSNQGFGPT